MGHVTVSHVTVSHVTVSHVPSPNKTYVSTNPNPNEDIKEMREKLDHEESRLPWSTEEGPEGGHGASQEPIYVGPGAEIYSQKRSDEV